MVRSNETDPARGVYGISVAASLVGNAPQNLRLYEARGLVSPSRSEGGTRLYSEDDLARLRPQFGGYPNGARPPGRERAAAR
jgi:MerR family transcriptional regulator/heat shock protein HspR